jgi:hypothetical protein
MREQGSCAEVSFSVVLDGLAQFKPGFGQVVHLLEVEPEFWAVAEEAS